jgi:hypothetical protein
VGRGKSGTLGLKSPCSFSSEIMARSMVRLEFRKNEKEKRGGCEGIYRGCLHARGGKSRTEIMRKSRCFGSDRRRARDGFQAGGEG